MRRGGFVHQRPISQDVFGDFVQEFSLTTAIASRSDSALVMDEVYKSQATQCAGARAIKCREIIIALCVCVIRYREICIKIWVNSIWMANYLSSPSFWFNNEIGLPRILG